MHDAPRALSGLPPPPHPGTHEARELARPREGDTRPWPLTSPPAAHDELITLGAAGYAALDWTSFASNRINTGGDDVWGRYQAFAQERLTLFRAEIARLGRQNAVRQRRMYTNQAPSVFEQSRVKY